LGKNCDEFGRLQIYLIARPTLKQSVFFWTEMIDILDDHWFLDWSFELWLVVNLGQFLGF
jgi:hypothetical protein